VIGILESLNQWSHGQIWNHLIIVRIIKDQNWSKGEETCNRACKKHQNLLTNSLNMPVARSTIFKNADESNWEVYNIDPTNLQITRKRLLSLSDLNNLTGVVLDNHQAAKCVNPDEDCWEIPAMDIDKKYMSNEDGSCKYPTNKTYFYIEESRAFYDRLMALKDSPMIPPEEFYRKNLQDDIQIYNSQGPKAFLQSPWVVFSAVLLCVTCLATSQTIKKKFRCIRKSIRNQMHVIRGNLPTIVWTGRDNENYYEIIKYAIENLQSISDTAKLLLLQRWLPEDVVFGSDKNLQSKLGSGYFGVVHSNTIMLSTKLGENVLKNVAIKRRNKTICCNENTKCESLHLDLREAAFMAMCDHAYVVQLLGKKIVKK